MHLLIGPAFLTGAMILLCADDPRTVIRALLKLVGIASLIGLAGLVFWGAGTLASAMGIVPFLLLCLLIQGMFR